MDDNRFLTFDEFTDVEDTLAHIERLVPEIVVNNKILKWIVLATHNCLQGACVCYLTRSDNLGAFDDKSEKLAMKFWYGGNPDKLESPPSERLASLTTLLNRLPDRFGAVVPKTLSECATERQKDLFRLNYVRNGFVHFPPHFLMIEMELIVGAVSEALRLIAEIANADDFPNRNRFNTLRLNQSCEKILAELETCARP